MSNLSYSEYQTDNNNKKRLPTIGKPKLTDSPPSQNLATPAQSLQNTLPPTIESSEIEKQKQINRVNELLGLSISDDDQMAQFNPIPNPILNKKPELDNNKNPQPMKYVPILPSEANVVEQPRYSNYRQIYEQQMTPIQKPYYANMGIQSANGNEMTKILEKLNYITHLLEEQRNEKTDNIGEEFLLYTFLGVFIIYVVDSFSRSGKYIR